MYPALSPGAIGVGLPFEEGTLRASAGVSLAAWHVAHPAAKGSIIFCHGNAGNMADRLLTIKLLHLAGYHVLIFDYRGYGRSAGRPSEDGTYLDAEAAWHHVAETLGEPAERIAVIGRSLGGAIAIELARRHPPAALVVESTFTSLVDVGRLHYPWLPVRWLLRYRYDSIDKVGQLTCPKLFFHGEDDELIPLEVGRRLYQAAAEPKQFVQTPGGHNSSGFTYSPEYAEHLAAFLSESLAWVTP